MHFCCVDSCLATVALPPIFYGEFRSELPDEVRFVDFSGRRFTMLLHKTPSLCLIVGGFPQLINAFTIKGRCWFFMVYVDSIHSNLPSAIYPKGDTYTIQFASTIQNLPMLSLLLKMYLTFVTTFVAKPLDYRAFTSMLGHYSLAYPGALHSLLPKCETVVVDKKITKYQADEYILTLPISFVQRAFGTKPDQVNVVDDAGLCYKVDVRSKPSRLRECYFGRGWRPFSQ
ncbi:hypothetical protein AHAS_Ahas13G0095700 [Arachis hypogaea]